MLIHYLFLNLIYLIKCSGQYLTTSTPYFFNLWGTYHSSGVIHHIDSNVSEPFEAWYDESQNASRIDYYHGTVSVIYRANEGPYGVMKQILPVTTETVFNKKKCFYTSGTMQKRVEIQSVFPLIHSAGYPLTIVTTELKRGGRSYLFLDPTTQEPVLFEQKIYVRGKPWITSMSIKFRKFDKNPINPSVFQINENLKCKPLFGHNNNNKTKQFQLNFYKNNIFREVINGDESHTDSNFEEFQKTHGKTYSNENEKVYRRQVFKNNLRYIESMNRKGLSYELAVNHFADHTFDEIRSSRREIRSTDYYNGQLSEENHSHKNLPVSWDWREKEVLTMVKNQQQCGSCWAFTATGAIESAVLIKYNKSVILSEQSLIDCSWGFKNWGCSGGTTSNAFHWIMKHGIPTEKSYGMYLNHEGYCHYNDSSIVMGARLQNFTKIKSHNIVALKTALLEHGPVAVTFDASDPGFTFYHKGVYGCQSSKVVDHTLLLIGYGTLNGADYWLLKNQWSTRWGIDGFIRVAQGDNDCGISANPIVPIIV